jgi:hypothetical protein
MFWVVINVFMGDEIHLVRRCGLWNGMEKGGGSKWIRRTYFGERGKSGAILEEGREVGMERREEHLGETLG